MGNNDNRVVTHVALNQFIIENGGSPKNNNANSYAIPFGEFNQYAPMATASSSGIVISDYTGIGGGAYTSNQLVIEKDVTWFNYVAPIVTPSSITVAPDATLNPGLKQQLTATVLPANAADKSVTWSSENASVATVDQNGLVTAVAVGQPVKIYATSNADPNVKGYATITVVAAPVTRYSISWSGDHVSIPGSTSPVQQNEGTSWSGTFVADEGYEITNISTTGSNVTTNGNTVSVSDLQSNVTITVTTEAESVTPSLYNVWYNGSVQFKVGEGSWDLDRRDSLNGMNNTAGGHTSQNEGGDVYLQFHAITGWKIDSIIALNNNTEEEWHCDNHTITLNSDWQWAVAINGIRGDISLVINVSEIPEEYITYKTNIEHALYLNYGTGGAVPDDRRLTFDDFTTPCPMVTTDGIHNTPISIGGDEAATFFTLPGYEISDVSVVWDGEEPSWVTTEGHNQYDDPVTIQYNKFNGSFRVVEGLKSGATVTITVVEEESNPELTVSDTTVRIGGEQYVPYQLSDSSITIDKVEFEIADTSIAEITGDEALYKKVLGKAVGETTVTVTINDTIVGTGTVTVINVLDGYEDIDFYNKLRTYDIFGNKSPIRDSYNSLSWHSAIPTNQPDGDWDGVVDYFDGYNIQTFYLGIPSNEEFQYMNEHIELSDDSWLTVSLERSGNAATIVAQVDPWMEKINDLIETAAENTEYNQVTGKNAIMNFYGSDHDTYNTYSSSIPHRTCIVTLHASDGSTLDIPIIQNCSYAGKCVSGGGSDYALNLTTTSRNIWESIDWYGPEGSNFTQRGSFGVSRNADVNAFAVLNPASSVQGITGLPSIIVATFPEVGNVYDPSFVKIATFTIS